MERLSLRHLSPCPLTRVGAFSIYNDPSVKATSEVRVTFDMDGAVFVSRYGYIWTSNVSVSFECNLGISAIQEIISHSLMGEACV